MRFKEKKSDGNVFIDVSMSRSESIDGALMGYCSGNNLSHFLSCRQISENCLEYTAPSGSSIAAFLKKKMSSTEFWAFMSAVTDALQEGVSRNVPMYNVALDLRHSYFDSYSAMVYLIFVPALGDCVKGNMARFMKVLLCNAKPADAAARTAIAQLQQYLISNRPFELESVRNYINTNRENRPETANGQNKTPDYYYGPANYTDENELNTGLLSENDMPVGNYGGFSSESRRVAPNPQPSYSQQPSYNNQPGYAQQPAYDNQPGYVQQPAYNQPSYSQQPSYNNQPSYVQQPAYNQPSYVQQPAYNQPGYAQQPAYNQPGYVQQPAYNPQPSYAQQPSYNNQPAYTEQPSYYNTPSYSSQPGGVQNLNSNQYYGGRSSAYSQTPQDFDDGDTALLNETPGMNQSPAVYGGFARLRRLSSGEEFAINKASIIIGKDRNGADIYVSNNPAVSRRHAEICCRSGRYFIKDLGSKNHSYLNGQLLPAMFETEITDGSALKLADEDFVFSI